MANKEVTIAAVGDIHVKESSRGYYTQLFSQISESADILVLAGDLCDLGLAIEAEILAEHLNVLKIPVVGVLGNHDHQSGQQDDVKNILTQAGMKVLGAEPVEIEGIGFAGVKGFFGGFDKYQLGSFGEQIIKSIVQETLDESLALENQLKQIESKKKVVVMHYSPTRETLEGEPLEIYPYLGSSRFVEPIENMDARAVFHGHAHHGSHLGKTPKGVPVYNVARPVMEKLDPNQQFAIVKI